MNSIYMTNRRQSCSNYISLFTSVYSDQFIHIRLFTSVYSHQFIHISLFTSVYSHQKLWIIGKLNFFSILKSNLAWFLLAISVTLMLACVRAIFTLSVKRTPLRRVHSKRNKGKLVYYLSPNNSTLCKDLPSCSLSKGFRAVLTWNFTGRPYPAALPAET